MSFNCCFLSLHCLFQLIVIEKNEIVIDPDGHLISLSCAERRKVSLRLATDGLFIFTRLYIAAITKSVHSKLSSTALLSLGSRLIFVKKTNDVTGNVLVSFPVDDGNQS